MLELLHEEQLQHALVCVQVCQLEQLPLQDVVVPDAKERRVKDTLGPGLKICGANEYSKG